MEESKMDRFKTGTKKLFGRTNERIKQKVYRSYEPLSKDDKWQVHVANFNRQQAAGLKLHREVKGYIASLKTLESSTATLLDAIREMHEYTWPGNMSLVKALQGLDKLTKELSDTMVDNMLVPVNNYMEVFPDVKERMNKRDRKLLDYTRCKRSLDTLKKSDKISSEKLGDAQEEYTQHKIIYEELNSELCEDLPQFWNSRKPFITKFLDGFFKQNLDYHREFSQVYSESYSSLEPLKEALRKEAPYSREVGNTDKYFIVTDNARKFKRQSLRKSFRKSGGGFKRSLSMGAVSKKTKRDKDAPQSMSNLSMDHGPYVSQPQQAATYTPSKGSPAKTSPPRPKPPKSPRNDYVNDTLNDSEIDVEDSSAIGPVSHRRSMLTNDTSVTPFSPSIKVEPGTVVECIHEYKAVDDDELTFVSGDVVTVVAWDSTDEQDEGWFMGVLQGTGAKGAFPINYTRKHTTNLNEEEGNEYDTVADAAPDLEDVFESIDLGEEKEAAPKKKNEYMNLPDDIGQDPPQDLPNGNHDNGNLDNGNHDNHDSGAEGGSVEEDITEEEYEEAEEEDNLLNEEEKKAEPRQEEKEDEPRQEEKEDEPRQDETLAVRDVLI